MTDTMSRPGTGQEPAEPRGGKAPRKRPTTAWTLFSRNRVALIGLSLLVAILLAITFGPMLYPNDPFEIVGIPMEAPGESSVLLGTDALGRDLFAELLYGGRATMLVGVVAAILSTAIGIMLGGMAGYHRGWADSVAVRITEFFQVLPPLLLAMVLVTLFTPSLMTITIAIGVVSWPATMRITRAEFLRIRELDYVKNDRAAGAGDFWIIMKTILPNALPPIVVMSTSGHRSGDALRGGAELPRPRRPQHDELGADPRQQPRADAHRLVARGLPWTGHLPRRAERQPLRRRTQRRPQPQRS
jgi:peptide/nickel transport system permease protein